MKVGATKQDLDDTVAITLRPLKVRAPFVCCCSRLTVRVGQSWSEYGEAGHLGHDTSPEASCRRMRMRFTPANIPSNSVAYCSGPNNGFCHHQRRARCRGCRGAYSLRIELVNIPQTLPSHSHQVPKKLIPNQEQDLVLHPTSGNAVRLRPLLERATVITRS